MIAAIILVVGVIGCALILLTGYPQSIYKILIKYIETPFTSGTRRMLLLFTVLYPAWLFFPWGRYAPFLTDVPGFLPRKYFFFNVLAFPAILAFILSITKASIERLIRLRSTREDCLALVVALYCIVYLYLLDTIKLILTSVRPYGRKYISIYLHGEPVYYVSLHDLVSNISRIILLLILVVLVRRQRKEYTAPLESRATDKTDL